MFRIMVGNRHIQTALDTGCRVCIGPECGRYYIVVIADNLYRLIKFKRKLSKYDVIVKY